MAHIIKFEAENIKRLHAVEITPKGKGVVEIAGKNDQGKSSILDAIMYALAGKNSIPAEALRKGEKYGTIRLKIGDTTHGNLTVERLFNEHDSMLIIKAGDEDEAPSPQAILDSLCGKLSFDPLEFARLKPKEQLATLRDLVGIDFSKLDADRAMKYTERTALNRRVKEAEAQFKSAVLYADAPKEEVSLAELTKQWTAGTNHNARVDELLAASARTLEKNEALDIELEKCEDQIAALQAKVVGIRATMQRNEEEAKAQADAASQIELVDVESLRTQMATAETDNAKVRSNREREKLGNSLAQLKLQSKALSDQIEDIDTIKSRTLAETKFPVEGLGFGENGITFNDLPFEQASSSQRIKVSCAIGMALNPELRVMLCRDASLLDEDSMAAIEEIAIANDFQLWLETVGEGGASAVVIEDGAVARVKESVTA